MNPSQARFAPAQVANTIKSALPPTWNAGFAGVTAAERAVVYRSNMNHYRGHVRRSLAENDLLQVAEKSWGAYTQAVKAVAADHGIRLSSHVGLLRASGNLADLVAQVDRDDAGRLDTATGLAQALHNHFYENNLPDRLVTRYADAVNEGINLIQQWFPPPVASDAPSPEA